jgi:hypothetical protein
VSGNMSGLVQAAVGLNMRRTATEQMLSAAGNGVNVEVSSSVYIVDGAKTWPTALTNALCRNPSLAAGTRQDMADLITRELHLSGPFNATRLSRSLSTKAKKLIDLILVQHGYIPTLADTGLGIRDAVKAGAASTDTLETPIKTKFHADGVTLGDKWYAYERVATYETEMPWYYLGLRFAGVSIPLKTLLAMRDIGIGEFQALDATAYLIASPDQQRGRDKLDNRAAKHSRL